MTNTRQTSWKPGKVVLTPWEVENDDLIRAEVLVLDLGGLQWAIGQVNARLAQIAGESASRGQKTVDLTPPERPE